MIFNSLESPLQCICFCYFVESFKRSNFFSFNLKSVFTQQSISSRLINNTKCFSSFRPLFITNETNYSVGDENGIYAIALNHNGTQAAVGLGSGNFTVRNIHWNNLKVLSIAYLLKWERNRFVAYFFCSWHFFTSYKRIIRRSRSFYYTNKFRIIETAIISRRAARFFFHNFFVIFFGLLFTVIQLWEIMGESSASSYG